MHYVSHFAWSLDFSSPFHQILFVQFFPSLLWLCCSSYLFICVYIHLSYGFYFGNIFVRALFLCVACVVDCCLFIVPLTQRSKVSVCFSLLDALPLLLLHTTRILHQIRFSIKFVLVRCRSYGLYCFNVIYTFYFHFIIHKTSISYCLYYNTALKKNLWPVCTLYISSLRFYRLGSLVLFTFDFSYCTQNRTKWSKFQSEWRIK